MTCFQSLQRVLAKEDNLFCKPSCSARRGMFSRGTVVRPPLVVVLTLMCRLSNMLLISRYLRLACRQQLITSTLSVCSSHCKFLEGLHVSFDFDGAQARLQECQKVRLLLYRISIALESAWRYVGGWHAQSRRRVSRIKRAALMFCLNMSVYCPCSSAVPPFRCLWAVGLFHGVNSRQSCIVSEEFPANGWWVVGENAFIKSTHMCCCRL